MSDMNGVVFSDLLGLSEPLTKLIETVSCGVGMVYKPIHIKRMAKAKAEEIKLISDTVADNILLPVEYSDGAVSVDSTDVVELANRAKNRFLFQQIKKQQNIESVISNAYAELETHTVASSTPVDDNWVSAFFDSVANVSDSQMQEIWGKLLAGEIIQPGRYSLRTLDTLKHLTTREANLFVKMEPYFLNCPSNAGDEFFPDDYFIPALNSLGKYNISFHKIAILADAGIFVENMGVTVGCIISAKSTGYINYYEKPVLQLENTSSQTIAASRHAYVLSSVGSELLSLIRTNTNQIRNDEYLKECAMFFSKKEYSNEPLENCVVTILP